MAQSATVDGAATAQSAAVLEGAARIQQAAAAVKIANTELVSVPKELMRIVAQAGYQSSTGTIAFAGQYASGGYAVQYNSPTGGFSSTWPQWAFELAKAAVLGNKRVWVASNGDPFGTNLGLRDDHGVIGGS